MNPYEKSIKLHEIITVLHEIINSRDIIENSFKDVKTFPETSTMKLFEHDGSTYYFNLSFTSMKSHTLYKRSTDGKYMDLFASSHYMGKNHWISEPCASTYYGYDESVDSLVYMFKHEYKFFSTEKVQRILNYDFEEIEFQDSLIYPNEKFMTQLGLLSILDYHKTKNSIGILPSAIRDYEVYNKLFFTLTKKYITILGMENGKVGK